jgi:DNA-binding MarR family transcriptional regulator/N-acetylglutamate synthase-like GNAT family acetyltransferase
MLDRHPPGASLTSQLAAAAHVRRFNRFYTRRIGLLDAGHLQSPFSLAEVRVLYEIANRDRPTASALAETLRLDPGYLSRLLRGLRQRGLVTARAAPEDRRHRHLALSAQGQKAFAVLDERATATIAAMLEGLSCGEQDRLLASLGTVETLLDDSAASGETPIIDLRPPQPGDLGWVVQRHGELYADEYGWDANLERLAAKVVGEFAAAEPGPANRCWIATLDGRRAGCVFLMPGEAPGVVKLRLLLVEPWARGHGLGGRLVAACISAAREAGQRTLTLWTNDVLAAARHLYERAGFRLVHSERHRTFGKQLVGQTWELALETSGTGLALSTRNAVRPAS